MNNTEYKKEIEALIPELERINEEAIPIAKGIIGNTLLQVDLGFAALLNRSQQLTDGFIAHGQSAESDLRCCAFEIAVGQLYEAVRALYCRGPEGVYQ